MLAVNFGLWYIGYVYSKTKKISLLSIIPIILTYLSITKRSYVCSYIYNIDCEPNKVIKADFNPEHLIKPNLKIEKVLKKPRLNCFFIGYS